MCQGSSTNFKETFQLRECQHVLKPSRISIILKNKIKHVLGEESRQNGLKIPKFALVY